MRRNLLKLVVVASRSNHCEEVRIDIDDFPEKEQKQFLDRIRQNNPDWVR